MAQAEDTELRDLVIEALEKNGSLAKIRALLRANIFLAFEDECDNIKQNKSLDNILNLPEGILCCSIVHEFLEYCNLKNTLFVYKSESRQGREYKYDGQKLLSEKLNFGKGDCVQEPILMTLVKTALQLNQMKYQNNSNKPAEKKYDNSYKDEQNCTYIVHEDSSSGTCNSQSDNSSDEKNKLHLRLQLDNSDTDTSSDSARDKSNSEYIPSEHVIVPESVNKNTTQDKMPKNSFLLHNHQGNLLPYYLNDLKIGNNSSSDSTSYVELKPFSSFDEKLLNTTGVPIVEDIENILLKSPQSVPPIKVAIDSEDIIKSELVLSSTMSSMSLKNDSPKLSKLTDRKSTEESGRSDAETAEYSYDFSSSVTPKKEAEKPLYTPESVQEDLSQNSNKNTNDTQQNSASSQSSVSISDVTDLLSEKSYGHPQNDKNVSDNSKSKSINSAKKTSRNDDDSGDFSESPVPSLSNLSLDIHSD